MERYANRSRNSGVSAFELDADYILARFTSGKLYKYSYASAGESNIEAMKVLALSGRGLCSFIQRHVKYKYVRS